MTFTSRFFSGFIIALLGTLLSLSAEAAKVLTVKQNKALIDLESDRYTAGTKLIAVDDQGKRRAILVIKQVKGRRAIADIIKGKAVAQNTLLASPSAKNAAARTEKGQRAWGLMGGYSMNSLTTTPKNSPAITMTGSSFSVKAFYQEQLDGRLGVKGSFGYDSMVAKGTSSSTVCTNCQVDIGYLGLDALIRYNITEGAYKIWAGAGLGFLFAISKSSNALDASKISINQTILGSLGVDVALSGGSFVPLEFSYAMFPNNNTSSANQMIFKVGYGFSF